LRFSSREISSIPCVRPSSVWNGMKLQRHELGEAAGALLQLAHDAHVLGELPRLLDVAEHHRRRRAQAGAWLASMISTQRATGSLLGEMRSRTPSCEHLGGGAGVEPRPASRSRREDLAGGRPETSHMWATSIGE
jgi:hypothetical protein